MSENVVKYLRTDMMPTIWCPGCGHGIIMGAVIRAIDELGLDQDRTVIVSGIGCASRAPGYMDFDTLHTTHGRALPFATGIKMANPDLNVIVLSGDGDASAIGGNHLIHAARRNINLTTICFNNSIYGMTSGQYSPMTPKGMIATTAPYGNIDRSFDICELVKAAGATYVARSTAAHPKQLTDLIAKAIQHKGFSFVEAISGCPTYFGRKNKIGDAPAMISWMKEHTAPAKAMDRLTVEQRAGKFPIGELFVSEEPEYVEEYLNKVVPMAKERAAKTK
jgi:2-oxoglutarate ferredoxin oxidoreductase subunit beta